MLTVTAAQPEPDWMTPDPAPGLRLKVRPWRPAAGIVGRQAGQLVARAGGSLAEVEEAFTLAVAGWAVVEWEGVGDVAGVALPISPEAVANLLIQHGEVYEAFDRRYVVPGLARSAEKNGSSAAPNGGSAAAERTTARPAPHPAPPAPSRSTRRAQPTA